MKFWLDKGVDGFRMDVIPFISKDQTFPDYPKQSEAHPEYVYASNPKLHDYLQEMNREALSKYDVMTVGEAFGVTLEQTPLLVDERRHELDMIFHFDVVRLNRRRLEMEAVDSSRTKSHLCAVRPGIGCQQLAYRLLIQSR